MQRNSGWDLLVWLEQTQIQQEKHLDSGLLAPPGMGSGSLAHSGLDPGLLLLLGWILASCFLLGWILGEASLSIPISDSR